MQAQIQALLAEGVEGERRRGEGAHRKVAKPPVFCKEAGKVLGFITACKLYIKARMLEAIVEEQVQWVLSFVQGGLANIWKENVLEDLEKGVIEYESVGEFFMVIRKEFGGGDEESVKITELKKLEQRERMMEEFVQEFKRAAQRSEYERRSLIEKFERRINSGIRRKLMEAERPLTTIRQWYERAIVLDRNERESRRKKERLRRKQRISVPKQPEVTMQQWPQPQVWPRR